MKILGETPNTGTPLYLVKLSRLFIQLAFIINLRPITSVLETEKKKLELQVVKIKFFFCRLVEQDKDDIQSSV